MICINCGFYSKDPSEFYGEECVWCWKEYADSIDDEDYDEYEQDDRWEQDSWDWRDEEN